MTIFVYKSSLHGKNETIAYTLDRQSDVLEYIGASDDIERLYELNDNSVSYETEYQRGNLGESFCLVEQVIDGESSYVLTQYNNPVVEDGLHSIRFDKSFITTIITPLPNEVVALQMIGLSDEEISEIIFKDFAKETNIDIDFWKSKFNEAKKQLDEYWSMDKRAAFESVVKTCHELYYVEVSSMAMAALFDKTFAKRCKPEHVKYILGQDVLPAQDGKRYMRLEGVDSPCTMWQTMYLLPNLDPYDKICNTLITKGLDDIKSKEDAIDAITSIVATAEEFGFVEQIPQWRKTIKLAFDFLNALDDEEKWTDEVESSLCDAATYLTEFPELRIMNIPSQYISRSLGNPDGFVYDKRRLRCFGIDECYYEPSKMQCIGNGAETVDEDVLSYLGDDYMSRLPSSVRRIGNTFINRVNEK